MTRPPMFPAPEFPPRRLKLFQRMPPVVFSCLLGLLGLGLALRHAAEVLRIPAGPVEAALGAVSLLWLFAVLGYGVKCARRPAVLWEDLAILPGRAGVSALMLGALTLASVLAPYAAGLARAVLIAGLVGYAVVAGALIHAWAVDAPGARQVTPVWHLNFVSFIVAGLGASALGWPMLVLVTLWIGLPIAAMIWAISAVQLARRIPPAPLRPLLAIHLAPAAIFGTLAVVTGHLLLAQGFAVFGALLLAALLGAGRWITASGFSPLWGSFTFPLAAYAGFLLVLGGNWLLPGVLVLILSIGIIPPIAFRVLQDWAKGTLAARSNAATA